MSTAAQAPIFIVGYMHSGTTMLQQALGGHSQIFATVGESKYFDFLPMTRTQYADLDTDEGLRALIRYCMEKIYQGLAFGTQLHELPPTPELSEAEIREVIAGLPSRDHGVVFGRVMSLLTARAHKVRWLEKTPTHIFAIEAILAAVPDARFVEIVRDPRDVLASKKTRRASVWTSTRYLDRDRQSKHLEKAYDPLWDTLSWKSAIRAGSTANRKHAGSVVRVRYEDLVAHPEREMRAICDALDLPFEPSMTDVSGGQPASDDTRSARGRGMSSDSIGRWKKTLSPAEVAVIQTVANAELHELGYEQEHVGLVGRARAVPVLAHSGVEFFVRLRRRQQFGGTRFLGFVIANYVRRAVRLIE